MTYNSSITPLRLIIMSFRSIHALYDMSCDPPSRLVPRPLPQPREILTMQAQNCIPGKATADLIFTGGRAHYSASRRC
jgi:hypothetical protein